MALAVAGGERLQGGHDAARERLQMLFEHRGGRQNVHLLDEVFDAFIASNEFKQRRYTASELITCASSWGRPKHLKFEHAGITYLATVDFWEGPEVDFINIRLPNNGFTYAHSGQREEDEIFRHRCGGWVELNGTLLMEFFPNLGKIVGNDFTSIVFYYNYKEQRIDMQLFTDDPSAPGLQLTFEPGYPYVDEQSQRRPLRLPSVWHVEKDWTLVDLLPACSNPACANLAGDSEAGLRLQQCGRCGPWGFRAVFYPA
ncbi:hypothetical protein TSOC_006804 [Tetrabaena socialis]|uniref:Uncharacterized protein n=1 Tax=Tetrabaena socialis TaxID=47790 RepID=A0A2J8A2N5_9CHLO|nr:hypothetical protein TSOC_006804 [Tetrabaena socialis]|eukprot:PNH06782.1 hypothetical protein TSOC_006804 [Tetrabaena socialis]